MPLLGAGPRQGVIQRPGDLVAALPLRFCAHDSEQPGIWLMLYREPRHLGDGAWLGESFQPLHARELETGLRDNALETLSAVAIQLLALPANAQVPLHHFLAGDGLHLGQFILCRAIMPVTRAGG